MGGLLLKLKSWWDTADRTQKIVTVGGAAFLMLLLFGTFMFASKPKMVLAYSGLSAADTGMVAMEIQSMGIPVEYDEAGNIKVPSDKVAQIKANLAMNGKNPKSSTHEGYGMLPSIGFMNTPKVEQERLKAIAEGELAQSIEFFDGVESARVHITLGDDSPFASEKKPAQASVTISERSGGSLTSDQGRAMAMLVASSVPGLDPKRVTIFSREGRAIWDGNEIAGSSGQAATKLDMEKLQARQFRDELQDMLNRIVGPGNALATVNVTLDLDQVEAHEETNTPSKKPIQVETTTEEMKGGSTTGSLPPAGMASNTPGGAPATNDGSSSDGEYVGKTEAKVHGQNKVVKNIKKGVGDLKTMGISILVNSNIVKEPAQIQSIEQLAKSYLGPKANTDPTNFSASVVSYPFDDSAKKEAEKAATASASAARMQQILSMLPILALIVVAFLVVRQLGKLGKNALPGPAMAIAGGGMMSLPRGLTNEAVAQELLALPEHVRQRAVEAGVIDGELAAALEEAHKHSGSHVSAEELDIPDIGNRVNVPLEQIKKMSTDRPEVVAMLIKSWLLEDGIRR